MRCLVTSLALLTAGSSALHAQSPVRIVVGPEFLVSRDGDVAHAETMIAANPRNPRNLIGGSIVGGRPGGGYTCKAYVSHDGGQSWLDKSFPELIKFGGADPQIVFTASGTAIFTCLAFAPDERGRTRAALYTWRSEDGGDTWSTGLNLGASYDHEMLTADQTNGPYSGRIYMSALYGREYRLGLFRSEDDGRSWKGPVEFTNGGGHGVNVQRMVVFSNGDLMASWGDFPVTPAQDSTWPGSAMWTAISKDGGVTFSAPRRVVGFGEHYKRSNPDIRLSGNAIFAVDPSDSHRDRVYMSWSHMTADGPKAAIVRSDDRGATWTAPKMIDPGAPKGTKQFHVLVAVNRDGTVGVSYYDTRGGPNGAGWHEYFTASVDGGDTFLPPVRVSTELSLAGGKGNDRLEPNIFGGAGGNDLISLSFISAASRWENGGDYLGMTVDSLGLFHPFWPDARTGIFQLWTASIKVERPPIARKAHPLDAFFPPDKPPPPLSKPTGKPVDVSKRVGFVFDPTDHDVTTGDMTLRVRLTNTSRDTIFGPVQVEIRSAGGPSGYFDSDERSNTPTILNASNSKTGTGAVFDFSAALGTDQVLVPGGQTSAVVWKLKLKDPRRTPQLNLVVTGVLR